MVRRFHFVVLWKSAQVNPFHIRRQSITKISFQCDSSRSTNYCIDTRNGKFMSRIEFRVHHHWLELLLNPYPMPDFHSVRQTMFRSQSCRQDVVEISKRFKTNRFYNLVFLENTETKRANLPIISTEFLVDKGRWIVQTIITCGTTVAATKEEKEKISR